jgi:hypothetical protein
VKNAKCKVKTRYFYVPEGYPEIARKFIPEKGEI